MAARKVRQKDSERSNSDSPLTRRHQSGGGRPGQLHRQREGRRRAGRPQDAAAQQADPEGAEPQDSELQGGVGVQEDRHGRPELLPGEQEGV